MAHTDRCDTKLPLNFNNLEDIRAYRVADCFSDHQLATAKCKIKLKVAKKVSVTVRKFDIQKFQDYSSKM
jgi:hypothetical protein